MKKFTAPLTLALACIVYGLVVVCEFHFAAQAHRATKACNTDCLLQKMDAGDLSQSRYPEVNHWLPITGNSAGRFAISSHG